MFKLQPRATVFLLTPVLALSTLQLSAAECGPTECVSELPPTAGIGFDLGTSTGTAALHYTNGTTIPLLRVPGSPAYTKLLQTYYLDPAPLLTPGSFSSSLSSTWRTLRTRLGFPASAQAATLVNILHPLKVAAESYVNVANTPIYITTPHPIVSHLHTDLTAALYHLELSHANTIASLRAVAGAYRAPDCIVLDITSQALSVAVLDRGEITWCRIHWREFDTAIDNGISDDIDTLEMAVIQGGHRHRRIVVSGEPGVHLDVRQTFKVEMGDVEFAAARGAAWLAGSWEGDRGKKRRCVQFEWDEGGEGGCMEFESSDPPTGKKWTWRQRWDQKWQLWDGMEGWEKAGDGPKLDPKDYLGEDYVEPERSGFWSEWWVWWAEKVWIVLSINVLAACTSKYWIRQVERRRRRQRHMRRGYTELEEKI